HISSHNDRQLGYHRDLYDDFLPDTSQHNLEYFGAFFGEDVPYLFSFHQDEACQDLHESIPSSASVDAASLEIPQLVPSQRNLVHSPVQPSPESWSQATPSLSSDFSVAPSNIDSTAASPQPSSLTLPRNGASAPTGTLICPRCSRNFQAASVLRRHAKTHNPQLQCDFTGCGRRFAERRDLNRHRDAIHGQPQHLPFFCSMERCDHHYEGKFGGFTRLDNATRHLRRKHANTNATILRVDRQ
ncbi:hypothetical protein N431DRAFT_511794, partial [Stipitochalara longipes BDJ]